MSYDSVDSYDEINYWSEIKLDIVRDYAAAYSTVLAAQRQPSLYHLYIDAFAGAGVHRSRTTGAFIPGSPLNALQVKPAFKEYHFIDIQSAKVQSLHEIAGERADVTVHEGDCNGILLSEVFPKAKFADYRRALCLLDPYGLHLNWEVVHTAGQMKSIELFLNFPVADMNRNVLWRNPDNVAAKQVERMNAFWGDESWRKVAYDTKGNLFGLEMKVDNANATIAGAYRKRLKATAGFSYVPEPIPMFNSKGAVVYYLFFASQKPVAAVIVTSIFEKYRNWGDR